MASDGESSGVAHVQTPALVVSEAVDARGAGSQGKMARRTSALKAILDSKEGRSLVDEV